jgi:hypothetical protein
MHWINYKNLAHETFSYPSNVVVVTNRAVYVRLSMVFLAESFWFA